MLKSLIVLLVLAVVGFWYWTGPYQAESRAAAQERFAENDRIMNRCLRRESSMNAAAGTGGAGGLAGDSKTLCAEKHSLYFAEGQWRNLETEVGDY